MDTFKVVIECRAPDGSHRHEVTIAAARGKAFAAGAPATARLQYTCPLSGLSRIMAFRPPRGAARPFEIRELG